MEKQDGPTVSDELKAAGFGHRKTVTSANLGKREVFSIKTGEIVGVMSAMEAIEFLRALSSHKGSDNGK